MTHFKAQPKVNDDEFWPDIVFHAIATAFPEKGSPEEIKKK